MTVNELKKLLEEFDGDALVVMSGDAEGNNHSPLANVWDGYYEAESTYSGMVYDDDELSEDTGEEFYSPEKAVKCVVFNPIN